MRPLSGAPAMAATKAVAKNHRHMLWSQHALMEPVDLVVASGLQQSVYSTIRAQSFVREVKSV